MKLTRIRYSSAMIFGLLALALQLVLGLMMGITYYYADYPFSWVNLLLVGPALSTIITYVSLVIAIFLYNKIAKKFPIAWEVAKK